MNSHEHSSRHLNPSGSGHQSGFPKLKTAESTLKSDCVQIDLKTFVFSLKQNSRGLFLGITEGVNGRRNTIIIPVNGLERFRKHLDVLLEAAVEAAPGAGIVT